MSDKIRGSEKLKMVCPTLHVLTEQEMEKVAGGAHLSLGNIFVGFPRGIPWPEFFNLPNLGQQSQF